MLRLPKQSYNPELNCSTYYILFQATKQVIFQPHREIWMLAIPDVCNSPLHSRPRQDFRWRRKNKTDSTIYNFQTRYLLGLT